MASSRTAGTNENISTFGDGTRDYTAISTWEAATDNVLTTSMISEVLECYDDSTPYSMTSIQFAGAATSADYRRILRAAEGHRHNGDPTAGVKFIVTGSPTFGFRLQENFFVLEDIIVTVDNPGGSTTNVVRADLSGDHRLTGVIVIDDAPAQPGSKRGFRIFPNTGTTILRNCAAIGMNDHGFFLSTGTVNADNCTARDNGDVGFNRTSGTITVRNCLSDGSTTADFSGTFDAASTDNASSDATAPGSNPETNQTFTYIAADDPRIANSDVGAQELGADLSADFDDDIAFRTRDVPWDIGCYEASVPTGSGGGGGLAVIYRRRRRS